MDGKIFNIIPIYGKGGANVQIVDLTVTGSAALTITADGHLKVVVESSAAAPVVVVVVEVPASALVYVVVVVAVIAEVSTDDGGYC